MIHASMRKVGPVERGAFGLIDALREGVGDSGTLLMVLCADETEPFDALRSPVDIDDTDGIATWQGGDYFPQIFLDYRATGCVRMGQLGQCVAELFDADPFVRFAVDRMNRYLGQSTHHGSFPTCNPRSTNLQRA